MQFAEKQIKAQ